MTVFAAGVHVHHMLVRPYLLTLYMHETIDQGG